MSTTISGHDLSKAERRTLGEVLDYMRRNSGDTGISPTTSPLGNGREVPFDEIFPGHNNQNNARKATIRRLDEKGVLKACELELDHGMFKWRPL